MDDDAVADDAHGLFVEDSGGEEVEFVLFALDDDGVAGVGSSGDSGAYVVFLWGRERNSMFNEKGV